MQLRTKVTIGNKRTNRRVVLAFVSAVVACTTQPKAESCVPAGKPQLLTDVREASGVAVGRSGLWTMNDSGPPSLFRLDAAGNTARVGVAGATVRDWEDLSIGKCPSGECLFVADIGDNRGSRDYITLYRVPEPPAGASSTSPAEMLQAAYPDGPHDAEALLVVPPRPDIFIITKEDVPRVYRAPDGWKPGERVALTFVRSLPERVRLTGGAASADGRWILLRSNEMLFAYDREQFARGGAPMRIDVSSLREPQGEGIAFGAANELYLVSESGDKAGAGMLTRIRCAFLK